jgi:hypothetical protein
MSHSDIIIITGTLFFFSTVGVYALIRVIKQHSRPPVNTLERSGDIQLVDYIEPVRAQDMYNYPDLLGSHYPIYERFSNHIHYGRVPSY